MTATREEIDRWREEDGLGPATDDTLARLFSDFKEIIENPLILPVFGQGQRQEILEKEKEVFPSEYERQELLDGAPSLDSGDYFEEIGYDH